MIIFAFLGSGRTRIGLQANHLSGLVRHGRSGLDVAVMQGAASAAIPKIEPILLLLSTPGQTGQQVRRVGKYATRKSQIQANEGNMQAFRESHFAECGNLGTVLHQARQIVCHGDRARTHIRVRKVISHHSLQALYLNFTDER